MLTQGVITGIGGGIIFTPCMALVATYFNKRRAIAIGLTTTGNSAGGMVYPAVVRELLPKVGFAWAARIIGFINLAGFILVLFLMRPRLKPRKSGPIIDWSAFREPVYLAYVAGMFFFVWAVYFTLYYVSALYLRFTLTLPLVSYYRSGMRKWYTKIGANVLDCFLWYRHPRSFLLLGDSSGHDCQRRRLASTRPHASSRRSSRSAEHHRPGSVLYGHHRFLLDSRGQHPRVLHLHCDIWYSFRCVPVSDAHGASKYHGQA